MASALSGLDLDLEVIDFPTSFSEVPALFDLLDTDGSEDIDTNEQIAALAGGYTGQSIKTAAQLVSVLNTSNHGTPDAYLNVSEVLAKLKVGFATDAAINALDVDGNGRINTGFEVNTGNPPRPSCSISTNFLISIHLGGEDRAHRHIPHVRECSCSMPIHPA